MPASGKRYDIEELHLFRVQDGRIAEHWHQMDAMGMMRAFTRMLGSVKDTVPAYARLRHYLGQYADGDPNVADSFTEMAQTGDDGFRDIYQYMAARTLLEQGRFEATETALETLRQRYPDGDFTHIVDLEHAWNFLRQGNAEESLAIFRRLEAAPPPARTTSSSRSGTTRSTSGSSA